MTREVLWLFLALIPLPISAQVDITLIDVGQGDSILVTFPQQSNGVRKRMLIDGGESTSANNPVVQFLRSQNIQELDFVVLSHPHFDHYGGLIEVFRQFTVTEFIWTGETRTGVTSWTTFATEKDRAGTRTVAMPGMTRTSKSAKVEVLMAGGNHPNTSVGKDINDDSLSMMLTYKGVKVLFTGDIEDDGGFDLVSRWCGTRTKCSKLNADIIKIPHHGSIELFTPFVAFATPDIVLVSAGFNNTEHHHPRAEALEMYADVGATEFFSTSANGVNQVTVTIAANGNIVRPAFLATETYTAWREIDNDNPCTGAAHEGLCLITVLQGSAP